MDPEKIIKYAEDKGAQYAEIRIIRSWEWGLNIRNMTTERVVGGVDEGVGVRVLMNNAWGFSSSSVIDSWKDVVDMAVKFGMISSKNTDKKIILGKGKTATGRYEIPARIKFDSVTPEDKIENLMDFSSSAMDNKILKSITGGYSEWRRETEYMNSEGISFISVVPRVVMQSMLSGKDGEKSMMYRVRFGGTGGYELLKGIDFNEEGRSSADRLMTILHGSAAPTGKIDVVSDPELTGVFVHEAVGHATEADLVTSGDSVLEDKIGVKIGKDEVTIYDDPTMKNAFGSYPVDDEGTLAQRKILIENGVLKRFMTDRETAGELGVNSTGNARGESYSSIPLIRMSNTMMGKGDYKPEEIFEDIKFGVYAKGTRGGQVDTAVGSFQFNSQEAYLIENGEITKPIFDFSLGGNIMKILNNIEKVGKDEMYGTPGYCGKGQIVPVGDGGPTIMIKNVISGGG